MPMSFLKGLRAIEVSSTPRAGFCGKMLADAGAEVIKLSLPGAENEGSFSAWLDRGKSSVVIDWHTDEGRRLLGELLGAIDVLVSDVECEGQSRELAEIAAAAPELIHASTSDLGHTGPFAGRPSTDLIVSALSGMCYTNGKAGESPLREPGKQTAVAAGIAAYLGVLAALINREKDSGGQRVEVSALETMVNILSPSILQCSYQNGAPYRRPPSPGMVFDCADGQISIMVYAQRTWDTLVALWGLEFSPEDAAIFAEEQGRNRHLAKIHAALAPILSTKTRQEIFEELCSARVICGMVMEPRELPTDPHLAARESFDSLAGDTRGRRFPGPSFRVKGERPGADRALPTLGAQTAETLKLIATREVAL